MRFLLNVWSFCMLKNVHIYKRHKWFIDEKAAPGIGIREEEVLIESNVKFEVEWMALGRGDFMVKYLTSKF